MKQSKGEVEDLIDKLKKEEITPNVLNILFILLPFSWALISTLRPVSGNGYKRVLKLEYVFLSLVYL